MRSHVIAGQTRGAGRRKGARFGRLGLVLGLFLSLPVQGVILPTAGLFHAYAAPAPQLAGFVITVSSTGDGDNTAAAPNCDVDAATPGDQCMLRAAIQAANGAAGDDRIEFAIPASDPGFDAGTGRHTISLTRGLPDLSTGVSIAGPVPVRLTVRRGTWDNYRIFTVTVDSATAVLLSGMTISNGEPADGFGGGGVATLTRGFTGIDDCVLIGNSSPHGGGGLLSGGVVKLTNSSVSGNTTSSNVGEGGGILNAGTLTVVNSTLSRNAAGASGGGIYTVGLDRASVGSSIVALNTASYSGPDVEGVFLSEGFNLIGKSDGSTGFIQPGDLRGTVAAPVAPRLDPNFLQFNGGPTATLALLPGSPAIDRGVSDGLTTDQRGEGFARTYDDPATANASGGDGTDIGAFEVNPSDQGGGGTDPDDPDDDGIPDGSDPDTVADVVVALPDADFNSHGNKNALLSRLGEVEQLILAGEKELALGGLQNLRRRVDGCGSAADTNDWLTDCPAQLRVRALIDTLIANLSA